MDKILETLPDRLAKAVSHYWLMREKQADRQKTGDATDQGARSAVTGGAQMDGFISIEANTNTKFIGKPCEPNAIIKNDIEFTNAAQAGWVPKAY